MTDPAVNALLIEDNPLDARLVREYLSEVTSARVVLDWADCLSAGVQRLHQSPPDVLLLDLGLPESQGLGTLSRVLSQAPRVPVVVITGLDDEELGYQAVAQGAQDFLVKGRVDGPLLVRSMRYAIERRHAEEALSAEMDRAQGYLDVAGVMLLAIGTDHRVTLVNQKGCEILGYEESEIVGKNWFDSFVPERLRNGVKAIFNQLATGQIEPAEYFESPVLTSSGEERVVAWHNAVITDSEGRITGTLSSGEDITDRKRSEDEVKQRARQLALVNRIGQRISPILALNQLYQAVVEAVQEELGYQNVALYSVQSEQAILEVVVGPQASLIFPGYTQHITEGMVGWVARTGETLLANDVSKEPRFLRLESIEVAAELDVPINLDDQTIGILLADSKAVNVFSDADVATLETVAHEVALAMHNATLYQRAQTRSRYLSTLALINATLRSTLPLGDVLETIVRGTTDALGYLASLILIPDAAGERLVLGAVSGGGLLNTVTRLTGNALESFSLPLEAEGNPIAQAFLTGERQFSAGIPEQIVEGLHPAVSPKIAWAVAGALGARSAAYIPLRVGQQAVGVLLVLRASELLGEEEQSMLLGLADQAALAIQNATLYQDAQRELAERKRAEEALQQSVDHLQRTLEQTVYALAATVEMRDLYTAGHQRRVANLAYAMAREMGLPADQARGVYMAGLIHDIGKIQIPAEILSKPTPLTEVEWGLIEVHPQMGYDILNGVDFPWPVAQIVVQHHERLDGSGYPHGLSGEGILLEARILAVADVVEAMSSHRPYRPAHTLTEALEEIRGKRGTLYEPHAVDACLEVVAEKASDLGLAQSHDYTAGRLGSRSRENHTPGPSPV
jgi:PAS domain S-box-containing protein/putative nucleotidyltransferase with HDIG domain